MSRAAHVYCYHHSGYSYWQNSGGRRGCPQTSKDVNCRKYICSPLRLSAAKAPTEPVMVCPEPGPAYVLVPPIFRRRTSCQSTTNWAGAPRRMRTRTIVQACLPVNEGQAGTESGSPPPGTSTRKKSKTEEIAELLGQDSAQLEAKAAQVKEEARKDNLKKYGLALASTLISTTLFAVERLDPNAGLNLMRFLHESSAPIEFVGTNGKPTMIEFSANWCTNCKAMARRVFELENEFVGEVNFVVVDGDDPNVQDIVDQFGVDGVPQFSMVSKDGKVRANLIGMVPKEALKSDLEALLADEKLPFPGLSLDELRAPLS